ncbi:MAG: glycosyltransferase family 39 protein, partial [Anaerolineae bacterium]|nr:glycosyltransferase family 39 protein [Anaerolineae bacterium]
GILLLALAARLYRLGDANLWWDEALAIWAVRKGLFGVTLWTAGDVHPPLYFWSLWTWVQLFGESEFAMRSLSAFLGVLTVAAVYVFARMIAGPRTGRLAALLTALARFHVWWSQEMRMYVLAGLLGTLSLYFALRWINRFETDGLPSSPEPARRSWGLLAAYVLVTIGTIYTLFMSGIFWLTANATVLIALLSARGRRKYALLRDWIGAQLIIALAVGAWLALSWNRMPTWSTADPLSPLFFVRLYATLVTTGASVAIERYTWAVILQLFLAGLGGLCLLMRWRRFPEGRRPQMISALSLWLGLGFAGLAIYGATLPRGLFYTPNVEARYFLPFAPFFWISLAWSLVALLERWRLAGGLALGITLTLWLGFLPGHYRDRFLRDELQSMTRAVVSQAQRGDAVLLDSGGRYPIYLYYYERLDPALWKPPVVAVSYSEDRLTGNQVDGALSDFTQHYQRLWLAEVDVNQTDPERLIRGWLDAHWPQTFGQTFGHNALLLYDPSGESPSLNEGYVPQHSMDIPLGHGGQLSGWDLPIQTVRPGSALHLALLWERLPMVPVAVALRNPQGQLVRRIRAFPPGLMAPQRQAFDLPIDETLPGGAYALILDPPLPQGDPLTQVRIVGSSAAPHAGPARKRIEARLGPSILLEGYTLYDEAGRERSRVSRPERVILDLYWRATERPEDDYTVFVHLLGEAHNPRTQGPVWGQHDSQPGNDSAPTSQWVAGDHLVDRHLVPVDADAPAGEYRIEIGMYGQDGQRLEITSRDGQPAGDHLVLEDRLSIKLP